MKLPNPPIWSFRPSALSFASYATTTPYQLYQAYQDDNRRAKNVTVPPPPPTGANLRTCQWNVHYFEPTEEIHNSHQVAHDIVQQVVDTHADVVVLNEFGMFAQQRDTAANHCRSELEKHGYTLHISSCFFPTAVATKVPVHGAGVHHIRLDSDRAAVAVSVHVHENGLPIWIYGTHLEAADDANGARRLTEMDHLLQVIQKAHSDAILPGQDRVMIVGDFNQQRVQDYTVVEWKSICASKRLRSSPLDDGVDTLLKGSGFHCIFDDTSRYSCNWPTNAPPPSTHWSGTLIDYTYFRGKGLQLQGVYVSPCSFSDHRMVVCDWNVD